MKYLPKLLLLTLSLVVVFAVAVSFLPRHASAQTTVPRSNLTLVYGTSGCPNSFVAILPTGDLSPATGCYVVPDGKYLEVTDVTTIVAGCPAGEAVLALISVGGPDVYRASRQVDAAGYASWHDIFTTGLVFNGTPVIRNTAGPLGCASFTLETQGYLTSAY